MLYWDSELAAFGVLVGPKTKTFIVQKDVPGQTKRRKIGRFPTWTVDQARKHAKELLVKLDKGEDPLVEARAKVADEKRQTWTRFSLNAAIDEHVQGMRGNPATAKQLRRELERHVGDWLSRPVVSITRDELITRHRKITAVGPYVANRVARELRAVLNSARIKYAEIPPLPLTRFPWNKESRRREPVVDLAAWAEKVAALDNGVRRDFQWFTLLTSARCTSVRTLRWENVDFDKGTATFPKPKGGESKSYGIPLCGYLLSLLAKRKLSNRMHFPDGDAGNVFPSFDIAGKVIPMAEAKQYKYVEQADGKVKKEQSLPGPHRLRNTWATAANECGVDLLSIKTLMGHALPSGGDVTLGYMRPSDAHLKVQAEKVAAFLLAKAGIDAATGEPLRKVS